MIRTLHRGLSRRFRLVRSTSRCLDQSGLTIIEMMVAVLVFAVVASGVAVAMGSSLNLTRNNRNRSISANLAAAELDELRTIANDPDNWRDDPSDPDDPVLVAGQTVAPARTVDGVDYTLTRDLEWVSKSATTSPCASPDGDKPAYLRATVKVTWPNMSGARAVQSQTLLAPPVGVFDAATGHIAVKIVDSLGAPAQVGHTVKIDGPSGSHTQTSVDGCAYFAYLAPGDYTVALMGTTGFVDSQGDNTPEQTVGVSVGFVSSASFDYDHAAALALTLGDGTYVVPDNSIPITVANPALNAPGTRTFARTGSDTGNTRTIDGLFPFPDGYQVWVGEDSTICPDSDPQSYGAQREIVVTAPGQVTTATLTLEQVEIQVTDTLGVPQANQQVLGSGACAGTYAGLDLGLTPSPPEFLKVGLPYGQWAFESGAGVTNALLDPTVPDPSVVVISG